MATDSAEENSLIVSKRAVTMPSRIASESAKIGSGAAFGTMTMMTMI